MGEKGTRFYLSHLWILFGTTLVVHLNDFPLFHILSCGDSIGWVELFEGSWIRFVQRKFLIDRNPRKLWLSFDLTQETLRFLLGELVGIVELGFNLFDGWFDHFFEFCTIFFIFDRLFYLVQDVNEKNSDLVFLCIKVFDSFSFSLGKALIFVGVSKTLLSFKVFSESLFFWSHCSVVLSILL